jgi:transcriptional regulator with XRE-family HTH domain
MPHQDVHHVCKQMRDLRRAGGWSLADAEKVTGVAHIAIGSYERGDRNPSLTKAEQVLNGYGYTLVAIPKDQDAVRIPGDMASELRAIADQIQKGGWLS